MAWQTEAVADERSSSSENRTADNMKVFMTLGLFIRDRWNKFSEQHPCFRSSISRDDFIVGSNVNVTISKPHAKGLIASKVYLVTCTIFVVLCFL